MQDYKEKLKHPLWQKKRLEIMNRDGFMCVICGNPNSPLHVHHSFYDKKIKNPWDYPDETLSSLCETCHSDSHNSKIGQHSVLLLRLFCELIDKPHSFVKVLENEVYYNIQVMGMTRKEAIKYSLLNLIKPA